MSYEMNKLLELMLDERASDLHLQVGKPPTLRVDGDMVPIEGVKLKAKEQEGTVCI